MPRAMASPTSLLALRECVDARASLHTVKVGTELLAHLPEPSYLNVQIEGDDELGTELLLYRQRP